MSDYIVKTINVKKEPPNSPLQDISVPSSKFCFFHSLNNICLTFISREIKSENVVQDLSAIASHNVEIARLKRPTKREGFEEEEKKEQKEKIKKEKVNFKLSGKLAADTNTVNGFFSVIWFRGLLVRYWLEPDICSVNKCFILFFALLFIFAELTCYFLTNDLFSLRFCF